MRLPLAANLTTRDGTLTKDAKLVNAFVESAGQEAGVFKRPGLANLGNVGTGLAQLLAVWNGQLRPVIGDSLIGVTIGQITPYSWIRTVWSGNIFCTIATGSDRKSATSSDGLSWAINNLPALDGWRGLAWNGSLFAATRADDSNLITNAVATSPDGVTWTTRTTPSSYGYQGVSWNGSVFCAISSGLNGNGSTVAATSPDGITWTAQTLPSSERWRDIAWNGSLFIATSGTEAHPSTAAAASPDGITWTLITLPTSGNWYRIATTNNGLSVMISFLSSSTNSALYSLDGITWSASDLREDVAWNGVIFNGSVFVAAAGNIVP